MPSPKRQSDEVEAALKAVLRYCRRVSERQCDNAKDGLGSADFSAGFEAAVFMVWNQIDGMLKLRKITVSKTKSEQ
jgi:hypothetical protein